MDSLENKILKKDVYLSFIEAFYDSKPKNTSKTSFDGTNVYFEIDRENDELLTEQNIKNIFKAVPQHTTKILN